MFNELKKFVHKNKLKNQMLIKPTENIYTNLINSTKLDTIINNMPKDLSEI